MPDNEIEILKVKSKLFDLLRKQEELLAQIRNYDQTKAGLIKQLEALEAAPKKEPNDG